MAGDAYDEGRHQRVYTGGDWNDYNRGQQDRARWESTTSPAGTARRPAAHGSGGGTDGGGAGGIGGLAALAVLLPAAALAAAAAVLAVPVALLLCASTALWAPGSGARYGQAYRAAFFAALAYLGATLAVGFALQLSEGLAFQAGSFGNVLTLSAALARCALRLLLAPWGWDARLSLPPGDWFDVMRAPAHALAAALLLFQGLPSVSVALALRRCLPGRFPGWPGFLLAGAVGTVAVVGSIPLVCWAVAALAGHAQRMPWPPGLRVMDALAWLAGPLALWAVLAGAGLAAVLEARIRWQRGASRVLPLYFVSVLICIGFGVALLCTLYFFRDGDPVLAALWRATGHGPAVADAPPTARALAGWALLQWPAVLAAAALVSGMVSGRFAGLPGFAWAVVLSAPVLVGSFWLATGIFMAQLSA